MNSTTDHPRYLADLLDAVLEENGLVVPDGRMLFKYAVSRGLLDKIRLAIAPGTRGAAFVQQYDRNACGLWVFLLCSAWSEHYFDGHWSWEQTLRQAGLTGFEGDFKSYTVIGLMHWKLPKDEFRGEYQRAIVRHAGLPRQRVLERDGYLYRLVRRVVLDNGDRDSLSESVALEQIRRAAVVVNLPRSFRKEAFLRSLAELASVIHRAIVNADNARANEAIRTLYPQFGQKEIDCLLDLQTRIIAEARESARSRPFRLRILRLIEVIGNNLSPLVRIEIGKTCQTSSITELFVPGESLRNHYMVMAHNGNERLTVADLRRVDAEQWDIRQHTQSLPHDWFVDPINITIERDGAEIARLNGYSSEAPDLIEDLVFSLYEKQGDDQSFFVLESGSPNAIDTEEFVIGTDSTGQWKALALEDESASNASEDLAAEDDTVVCFGLDSPQSFLPKIRFTRFRRCIAEICRPSHPVQYYFSSGDRHQRYRFVGQTYRTASEHAVTRGVPHLYRIRGDGSLERFDPFNQPRLEVFWSPKGRESMRLSRWDENKIYGPGHLELYVMVTIPGTPGIGRVIKSRILRQFFTIIPSASSIKKAEIDGRLAIQLVKWPIDDIDLVRTAELKAGVIHCLDLNEDLDTYIIFNDDTDILDEYSFRLIWSNNAVSEACFSAPLNRCLVRVGNQPVRRVRADAPLQIDFEEVVYTQFSVKTPRIDDSVRIVMCGVDAEDRMSVRRLWHFVHREVIKKESFDLTIRLANLIDRIRQQFLLCKSNNPSVMLEIQTTSVTNVVGSYQTVARCEIIRNGVYAYIDRAEGLLGFRTRKINPFGNQVSEVNCSVLAINLASPEDPPKFVGKLEIASMTQLSHDLDAEGIWFIHPAKDSQTSFAPALYVGSAVKGPHSAGFTPDPLQRAILTADTDSRAALFDDYLIDLENRLKGRDPRQLPDWKIIVRQCERLEHIESCYFDFFNALARRPAILALLVVLENETLSRFSANAIKSLKINWLLMGLNDWLLFMECFCHSLKTEIGPYLAIKSVVSGILDQKQAEIRAVLWNIPSTHNCFIKALFDLMFDRFFFPGEILGPDSRRTLSILQKSPGFVSKLHATLGAVYSKESVNTEADLSEFAELEKIKNSMPCTTVKNRGEISTLSDENAQPAFPALFYNEDEILSESFNHRHFFRFLLSQSAIPDQKTWRRWIESNFGLIQYSFHRHSAEVIPIFDECLLIQLGHYYHDSGQ